MKPQESRDNTRGYVSLALNNFRGLRCILQFSNNCKTRAYIPLETPTWWPPGSREDSLHTAVLTMLDGRVTVDSR